MRVVKTEKLFLSESEKEILESATSILYQMISSMISNDFSKKEDSILTLCDNVSDGLVKVLANAETDEED